MLPIIEAISAWQPNYTLLVGGLALESIPLALVHHVVRVSNQSLSFGVWKIPMNLIMFFRRDLFLT